MDTVAGPGELPLIILVHSGLRQFREYLLAMTAGHSRLWLLLDTEPTWELPYLYGHTVVDTHDPAAMKAAARSVAARHTVAGVVCWNELLMEQTAQLQQESGLPGSPPRAVALCRDKHGTRRALDAAGVPQARSIPVASVAEAQEAAARIGFPVVVKPRGLGASVGVSKVASPAKVAAAYTAAGTVVMAGAPDFGGSVLVEEYLRGEEISIDAALRNGELTPLYIARKVCGFEPYFEEIAHSVDAADPLLDDPELLDVLRRAHRAVGYHTGITHTELMLTAAGPKVIEINARLGGDLIPLVASVACGVDPGHWAVAIACGSRLPPPGRRQGCAAIRFLYPEQDCVAAGVDVDAAALPASTVRAQALAEPGQELLLPPAGHIMSRYGYVLVTGQNAAACWIEADKAAHAVRLSTA
ncbi:ATP-grasp domain-containing protein [Streptomyces sp. NPDC005408]|uniref:ATP-grasp domain-containing protein n=1 Tax=Streptomyces sp. NPDC005408 TaxID=3155341 RepID=UPI0033B539B8